MTVPADLPMPRAVVWFERLMYATLMLGGLRIALTWQQEVGPASAYDISIIVAALATVLGLSALMIWLVARRRQNWARILITVLTALALPIAVKNFMAEFNADHLDGVLSAIQIVFQATALVLIFTNDAKPWFKKPATDPALTAPPDA